MPVGAIGAGFGNAPQINTTREAANALEAMLFKQLMKSMTSSAFKSEMTDGGFQSDLYQDMFASVMAESAAGSGTGISEMFYQSLGGAAEESASHELRPLQSIGGARAYQRMYAGTATPPANTDLHVTVSQWVNGERAAAWGKDGKLTTTDLAADIRTETAQGVAVFNVVDAGGYQGHPKCNLFAFEALRRTGHTVPVAARTHGWGYMGADAITHMAQNGEVDGWAKVRTSDDAQLLDGAAFQGTPLLLAGAGSGDKVGHMAVADRIHRIERDGTGRIVGLEYSGWEATGHGVEYGRRVWRLSGVAGDGRGSLSQIEVLEPLKANGMDESFVQVGGGQPGASLRDNGAGEGKILND